MPKASMTSPLRKFVFRLAGALLSYFLFGLIAILFLLYYFPEMPLIAGAALTVIILLAFCVLYTNAWHFGERDRNLVKFGHIPYQPLRGAVAGAYACIPFIAAGVALFIRTGPRAWYFFFLAFLFVPVASAGGYIAGHRLFSVSGKLTYKNPKKNDKRLR